MSQLRDVLKEHYEGHLADLQFRRDPRFPSATVYSRKNRDVLKFDRGKGGSHLRVYLSIGIPQPEIEAESPWWSVELKGEDEELEPVPGYDPAEHTLEAALGKAWAWLETYGWGWFENPLALTPSEWGQRHGVIIRDHRQAELELGWPEAMPLNERIIRARRCIPQFRGRSALQLREDLLGLDTVPLGTMPLANALELKTIVEAEGLLLTIQRA